MNEYKLSKITEICNEWHSNSIGQEDAINEIEKVLVLASEEIDGLLALKKRPYHNPGPVTINSFFNYMKKLRETGCYKTSATELAQLAAKQWNQMADMEKCPYIMEAYKARHAGKRRMPNISCDEAVDGGGAGGKKVKYYNCNLM